MWAKTPMWVNIGRIGVGRIPPSSDQEIRRDRLIGIEKADQCCLDWLVANIGALRSIAGKIDRRFNDIAGRQRQAQLCSRRPAAMIGLRRPVEDNARAYGKTRLRIVGEC